MESKTLTRPESTALWERICRDPSLQDLPYKVETNEHGQIILSPHKNIHSVLQTAITDLLRDLVDRPGKRAVEFAVETAKGTKAPDVIWISEERYRQKPADSASSPVMPELCIEVLSGSNTGAEIDAKRQLYLEGGAEEVWIVSESGEVRFYDKGGQIPASKLVGSFPDKIEV